MLNKFKWYKLVLDFTNIASGPIRTIPENYIIQKKLNFYHHLIHLPSMSVAKQVLNLQKQMNYPGLQKECDEFLSQMHINVRPINVTKSHSKNIIKKVIHEKNKSDLLVKIEVLKKYNTANIVNEGPGLKEYLKCMPTNEAQTMFAIRTNMLKTVQMNYKHKQEYVQNGWKCCCGNIDEQSHLLSCIKYSHLREAWDISSDHRLVKYFQHIIQERASQNDE